MRATIAEKARAVALKIGAVASRAAAAATWLFSAAMRANPIGIVVTAPDRPRCRLVLAYKKSETFRKHRELGLVGDQSPRSVLWGWLQASVFPVFTSALQAIGGAATWLWQNAIMPAFNRDPYGDRPVVDRCAGFRRRQDGVQCPRLRGDVVVAERDRACVQRDQDRHRRVVEQCAGCYFIAVFKTALGGSGRW